MLSIKNSKFILALLLLATALVYGNSLNNPFVPDDRSIIFRFAPGEDWTLADLSRRTLFGTPPDRLQPSEQSAYFRPLTLLTFALNRTLARAQPGGYRIVNIILHLSVVALLFLFLAHLTKKWVAFFATLLFALHPAHVQAVSYISSRSDPLYAALALVCLLFWRKGNEPQGRRRLYLSLALSSFFLGLFAKENIVILPALVLAMDFIWNQSESWKKKIRENLGWYLGFALLFSFYLLVRIGNGFPLSMEAGKELAFGLRLLLALKLLGLYLALAFYPAHLSLFRVVPIPESFFDWQVLAGILLLVALVSLVYHCWSSYRDISFGILWFLISILPVLNLTLVNAPMMEHWLYLPLMGLTLAFVAGSRGLAERVGEVRGAAIGLVLLALLLAGKTFTRNAEWRDHVKLFSQDVSYYPGNYLAWFWLGDALKERGMFDGAIRAFQTGLAIDPNGERAWRNLGESLSLAGMDEEAERAFARAISIDESNPSFYHMLGVHRLIVGRYQAAVEALGKSLDLYPSVGAYHALGSANLRLGLKAKAEGAFQKALRLYPGHETVHAGTHVHLGKLFLRQGKTEAARQEWQLALRFDPKNEDALSLLSTHQQ